MNLFFYNIVDNMYKFKITHALLIGNRISIYRFLCLLFAFKFAKNANLRINFYKN